MDLVGVMAVCLLVKIDLRDLDGSRRSWRSPLYDGVCLSEKYSVSYFLCKLTFLFDEPFFIFA
jgi:hypothetical protein